MTSLLNWTSILQGVATGMAASIVFGIITFGKNRIKDFYFQRTLKSDLNKMDFGDGIYGLTINVANRLGKAFTVRRVSLQTEGISIRFSPTDRVESYFEGQSVKLTRKQIEEIKKGAMIEVESELSLSSWKSIPMLNGFVKIEPFTQHEYVLPPHLIAGQEIKIRGIKITIEYEGWKDKRKIFQFVATKNVSSLQEGLDRFQKGFTDGSLNNARALFNLPPVIPISKNSPAVKSAPVDTNKTAAKAKKQ